MTVNIDLDTLIQNNITPDDYIFLWSLYHSISLEIEIFPNHKPLEDKGLIKIGDKYILTNKGKDLFEPKGVEAKFIEFYTSYPQRVSNGMGGYRALRDSGSDTKRANVCLKKYENLLKRNPKIHTTIMNGLRNYISNSNRQYLVNVEVFLNQEYWNKYVSEEKSEEIGDDI